MTALYMQYVWRREADKNVPVYKVIRTDMITGEEREVFRSEFRELADMYIDRVEKMQIGCEDIETQEEYEQKGRMIRESYKKYVAKLFIHNGILHHE